MEKIILTLLAYSAATTVGVEDGNDYDEYQYDEAHDDPAAKNTLDQEIISHADVEMLTRPLVVSVTTGENIELPCRVNKLSGRK